MNTFIQVGVAMLGLLSVYLIIRAVVDSVSEVLDFLDDSPAHHWDH